MKNEASIRKLLKPFYTGSKYECNVCVSKLSSFVKAETGELCPLCGSLERTRFLSFLLSEHYRSSDLDVLHFSPHRTLGDSLRNHFRSYQSSNYEDESCDLKLDIQTTGLQSESFNLIICFHVLEHIPDDIAAMKELYRLLKSQGSCLIQVPFRDGEMLEDPSVEDPTERLRLFGQEDHLRWYNLQSLKSRLSDVGFECEELSAAEIISDSDLQKLNISVDQLVVRAIKP